MQLVEPLVCPPPQRRTAAPRVVRRPARRSVVRKTPSQWKRPLIALGVSIWVSLVGFCIVRDFGKKTVAADIDPARGKAFYQQSCVVCHGVDLQGMPRQGVELRHSKFIAKMSDAALRDFIKTGRTPDDPESLLKLDMPARGGNPSLTDNDLMDVVAYLRQVQEQTVADPADTEDATLAGM